MGRIDPGRIRTREDLHAQLVALFHAGGWSVHRLAAAAGLSPATVQGILDGSTGLPRTGTLQAFVQACGKDPVTWIAARGRIVQAEKNAGPGGRSGQEAPAGQQGQGVVYLPYRAEELFVGRTDELARLDAVFTGGAGAVVVRQAVGAVHGLGGIGKSTLAAHWAHTHLHEHRVTWWITADTPTALHEGLAGLAAALEPERAGQPLEVLTEHALAWLAAHDGWLLVLDNVSRPADLQPLLARCRTGRVLITSRLATGWHTLTDQIIPLNVLSLDEAVELLTGTITRIRPGIDPGRELEGAVEVCQELGCLPLAIEQAAAFIAETATTPRHYLELLAGYPADAYAYPPAGADIDRTVARVWHATLDHLAAETPQAGQVLRVLAWFAPDHIPRTLLDPLAGQLGGRSRCSGRSAGWRPTTSSPSPPRPAAVG